MADHMKLKNETSDSQNHQTRTRSKRSILELYVKAVVIGGLISTFVLHGYTAWILLQKGLIIETIWPTLLFDLLYTGGCLLLWIFVGRNQCGGFIQWLSFTVPMVVNVYLLVWQADAFDLFSYGNYGFYYGPINASIVLLWIILSVFAAVYLLGYPVLKGIYVMVKRVNPFHNIKISAKQIRGTITRLIIPVLCISLAFPLSQFYFSTHIISDTLHIADTNQNCSFSIWDLPPFSAQVNKTSEIDLNKLTPDQIRTLTAFGQINTTFYTGFGIGNELGRNKTLATLKMLDAFNLTVCWTIWPFQGFPGPSNPERWITNARSALEFCIANNITNVIGICADSEAGFNGTPAEYWYNIGLYDTFLQEVQTNSSLRHPDPARGTFETVLCFADWALQDFLDGDQDLVVNGRELGLPPGSWTKYHMMLYRVGDDATPSYLYNFNTILKENIGTKNAAPIVGLTGVTWFANGYFNRTNPEYQWDLENPDFDGIDGWAAMKREIFFCKAMGFETVSVFHLNSYNAPGKIEDFGLLDYYGVDAIEQLATEWNLPKTIDYPIGAEPLKFKKTGFFMPNGELQYDLALNPEMLVVRIIIIIGVCMVGIFNLKRQKAINT